MKEILRESLFHCFDSSEGNAKDIQKVIVQKRRW